MSGDGAGTETGSAPVRVAVTGTPGTGKTTATDLLAGNGAADGLDCEVLHLNDAIRDNGLYESEDAERGSLVADMDALAEWVDDRVAASEAPVVILESHLAHHLDADRVAVLRCAPEELESRLTERGDDAAKASENAESEALDLVLSEAVARHGPEHVYEIDTTGRDPDAVAEDLRAVVEGTREPSAGEVDFTGYL